MLNGVKLHHGYLPVFLLSTVSRQRIIKFSYMYIKFYKNELVLKTSSSPSPTVNMFLSAPESSSCAAGEMLGIPVGVTVVNGSMMRVFKRSLIARPLKRKKNYFII